MAVFAMQSLGCEVASLNTVDFSRLVPPKLYRMTRMSQDNDIKSWTKAHARTGNHTGYRQFKGTRSTARQITELYQGLLQSNLTDFDVMLSGYAPSAAAVEAVGAIGIELQKKAENIPGSFFWGKIVDMIMEKKNGCKTRS